MQEKTSSSDRPSDRELVYDFIVGCAGYLERMRGQDVLTQALRMDTRKFQTRWKKLDKVNRTNLVRIANEGIESFFANLQKGGKAKRIRRAAHSTRLPVNNRRMAEVYKQLMVIAGDDLEALDKIERTFSIDGVNGDVSSNK